MFLGSHPVRYVHLQFSVFYTLILTRTLSVSQGRVAPVPGPAVGYAPQEAALYEELTVDENLRFYARLHAMSSAEYEERYGRSPLPLCWCFYPNRRRRVSSRSFSLKFPVFHPVPFCCSFFPSFAEVFFVYPTAAHKRCSLSLTFSVCAHAPRAH